MNGPSEEIQPVRMHSRRYFSSLPSSKGSLTGMGAGLPWAISAGSASSAGSENRVLSASPA